MIKLFKRFFAPAKHATDKNTQAKRRSNLILFIGLLIVSLILAILVFISRYSRAKPESQTQEVVISWDSAFGKNFTDKDNQSALKAQQIVLEDLTKDNKKLSSEVSEQQKALDNNKLQLNQALHGQVSQLRTEMQLLKEHYERSLTEMREAQIAAKEAKEREIATGGRNNFSDVGNSPGNVSDNAHNNYDDIETQDEFLTFHISADHHQLTQGEDDNKKTIQNYVPTGTFCRAVILGGADANAGVNGQSNTTPINFKILDNCHLPNGKKTKLKGGFVTAAVLGDISSERGEIKLDRLSLIHTNGEILDISVEGTAYDVGGNAGIRGIPVLKNGKIVQMAGTSGLFSGLGDAAKSYAETQSVSALGSTTTLNPAKVPLYGAGSGLNTAFSKISDYYIKLADQYHPIVELKPGAVVDLLFLKGFSLDPKKAEPESIKKDATQSIASNILDQARLAVQGTPEMPVPVGQMTQNNLNPQTAEAVSNHINEAVQRGQNYV